jgi:two-component system, LytTR family, response regulator
MIKDMIKVVIVDDEERARGLMRKLCERYFNERIEVVAECVSVENAVTAIRKYKPDVVFLDIQMPNENGFKLFNYFEKIEFEVVFTTAHRDYAIEAIRKSALDYLTKPIVVEDFINAIEKFETSTDKIIEIDRFKVFNEIINNQPSDKQRIVFPVKNGFNVIQTSNIIYCKADKSYTEVHTTNGVIISSRPFKEICEFLLEPVFIKVHKSFLVNKNYIRSFISTEYCLEMMNNSRIDVSDKLFNKKKLMDVIAN